MQATDDKVDRLISKNGTIKRIHVDQKIIRQNIGKDWNDQSPPITVQTSAGPRKAWEVHINGPSTVAYRPKPLSCGARVWVETTAPVEVV